MSRNKSYNIKSEPCEFAANVRKIPGIKKNEHIDS